MTRTIVESEAPRLNEDTRKALLNDIHGRRWPRGLVVGKPRYMYIANWDKLLIVERSNGKRVKS